jgi:hypothetical protein
MSEPAYTFIYHFVDLLGVYWAFLVLGFHTHVFKALRIFFTQPLHECTVFFAHYFGMVLFPRMYAHNYFAVVVID